MKRTAMVIFCLGALCGFIDTVCADEDVALERIVVTPSRVEEPGGETWRKIDVITAQDAAISTGSDLSQALNGIASANLSNYGGLGANKHIKMRGSTSSQVLVMVDGRPINSPRDGEADLSSIPLDNVEQVEVMHGPASTLYGSSAMGGAVNIITRRPPEDKLRTEMSTSVGTFRTYQERMIHGGRLAKFGYLLNGAFESSEGFRDNSGYNAKDAGARFEYDINTENVLFLNTGFYTGKAGAPGPVSSPDIDDKQITRKNFQDLRWNFKNEQATGISARVYQNYDRLEFAENTAGSFFDVAESKARHTTRSRGLDLQLDKRLTDIYRVVCGFNYVKNLNDSNTSGKHDYNVRAGFMENQIEITDDLLLNVSARADDYSNFGTEINPGAGFLYFFNEKNKLRGQISRSFRAPTFNDLYWPDEGWSKGNPELMPEKGVSGEIGFETSIISAVTTGITYFRSGYSNLINWAEEAGVWMPKNVNSAVINGIEFENTICLFDGWKFITGYTYLRAKDNKSHADLIYQPRHKLDCALRYDSAHDLVFELNGRYMGQRFHDAANTLKMKDYFIFGAHISQKIKSVTLFANIDNLLNETYQYIRDYPLPGFGITGGMKLEF